MSRFFNGKPGLAQLHKVMRVESFPVACGEFIGISDVEKEELEKPGWALVPEGFRHREGMFGALLRGDSMTPRYYDGEWGLFVLDPGGTRQNRIVLVEHRREGMNRYSLKQYKSVKAQYRDGT